MTGVKIDINSILKEARIQINNLASATASKYKDEATAAGERILLSMREDLEKWAQLYAEGRITTEELELLVRSYQTEFALAGLQMAGLAAIRVRELGINILNVVIDVTLRLVAALIASA